jgi:hypothetical protein
MNVFGPTNGDFFYTQPAVMAMTNAIHAAIGCIAFSGSGQIDVWVQTSDDLETWLYVGGTTSPPGTSLLAFTAVGAQQASVAPGASSPYNVTVGAVWVRFVFRVTNGGGGTAGGTFAVRVNTFVA